MGNRGARPRNVVSTSKAKVLKVVRRHCASPEASESSAEPLGGRGGDGGKSAGHPGMGCRGVEAADTIPPHARAPTATWSLIPRKPEQRTAGAKADARDGPICWGVLRRARPLVYAHLAQRLPTRSAAAGPSCAGHPGQAMGQRHSVATPLAPLVQRPSPSAATRDCKARHAHPWRRPPATRNNQPTAFVP